MLTTRQAADTFALHVVQGAYSEAASMLSPAAQENWTEELIEENYQAMIRYFDDAEIEVITNWDELEDVEVDNGMMLYVPIEADGESEAITVVIDEEHKIVDIGFGRP